MSNAMRVTYDDGRVVEVETKRFDFIQLERARGKPIALLFASDNVGGSIVSLEDLWFVAFCAAKRANPEVGDDFDAWAETVDDVEDASVAEVEPTPLDHTP